MEMWCRDDMGRESWDWVGPPAWGRACFNSPEWGGASPVKTEPHQTVLLLLLFVVCLFFVCLFVCLFVCCLLLLLNGYIILKEYFLLDVLTLAIFLRSFSSVKCVFLFHVQ